MKNLHNDQEPFDLAIISFILIVLMFNSLSGFEVWRNFSL